jgi:formimidoylglutamate deiminase
MSLQSRYRFTTAWLPAGWRRNVVISVDSAGDIVGISPDDLVTTARAVSGAAIPGMPNVHSHAFQRAMAGLAERRTSHEDSFWSWREGLYELASRMSPDSLNAIAAQLYTDMLKAGYTSVCEFHYLHHQPDGRPFDDSMAMCQALIDAAATTGIGLTLLPALYQTADFGAVPPQPRQRQFVLQTQAFLDLSERLRALRSNQLEIGIALHSLRAVPPESLSEVVAGMADSKTLHIHIAEQEREVEAAQRHWRLRPIEWLLANAAVDERWCLVHATHATAAELAGVAATNAVIALCPTTEANLGDGLFPLPAWLDAGGAFAIGSDSHITVDPAEELRWLEYQARLERRRRNVLAGDLGQSTGSMLWRKACHAGARASARRIGAFDLGARADIVVLDLDAPLFAGRHDDAIVDTFVFAGGREAICDVMVGGRWLVEEGRHFAETPIGASYKRAIAKLR